MRNLVPNSCLHKTPGSLKVSESYNASPNHRNRGRIDYIFQGELKELHWLTVLHQAVVLRLPFIYQFFTPVNTGQVNTL